MVDDGNLPVEVSSLRQELKLRILLQNALLQILTLVFVVVAIVTALYPESALLLSFVFQCAMLAAALQWCHHGIRTRQIKQFLQCIDPAERRSGWEAWLPANRPATLLGSRWMISTKGVFLGLGAAMIGVGVAASGDPAPAALATSVVVWGSGAFFLLTNPKE